MSGYLSSSLPALPLEDVEADFPSYLPLSLSGYYFWLTNLPLVKIPLTMQGQV